MIAPLPPKPPVSVLKAVGVMLIAVTLLSAMGVLVKVLLARYGASELSAWRNLLGMIPSALILWSSKDWQAKGRPLRLRRWKLGLLRGCFVALAQLCYYLGLARLEYATAATLLFAGPLFVTSLSGLILRAPVGAWRWSAVLVGFAGVAMILRPGADAFSPAAFLPLLGALGYASAAVCAPMIDEEAPTALINLYSSVSAMGGAILLALSTGGFTPIHSWADFGLILGVGATGGIGVFCLVTAYRLASPPVVTPFEYFGMICALLFGWAVFAENPLPILFPGALFIVAAGLTIAWRERRKTGA